jgi:diadenosine tetraphosphate (Ap4A) HIT family hydrolase
MYKNKKEKVCPFCKIQHDIIAKNKFAIAIADKYPVTKDHTLIVPLRHISSFFDLDYHETNACLTLMNELRQKILK